MLKACLNHCDVKSLKCDHMKSHHQHCSVPPQDNCVIGEGSHEKVKALFTLGMIEVFKISNIHFLVNCVILGSTIFC